VATLLNGNVIVGFSPAASAGKPAGGALASGDGAASQPGIFGALLGFAAAPSVETGIAAAKSLIVPAPQPVTPAASAATSIAAAARPGEAAMDTTAIADPDAVMADLVDALAALSDALDTDTPPGPALEERVTDLVDSLAGLLGLPVTDAVPPDNTARFAAAAGPTGIDGSLDALAAIAAAGAPPVSATSDPATASTDVARGAPMTAMAGGASIAESASATAAAPVTVGFTAKTEIAATAAALQPVVAAAVTAVANAAGLPEAAKEVLAALGLFTRPETAPAPVLAVPAADAQTAGTPAPQGAAATAAVSPETPAEVPELVKKFASKLVDLADAIKPQSPALAERLAALASKLTSGEIDAPALEKLGLTITAVAGFPETDVELAIERLLAPVAAAKAAPSPAPFVAAELALPAGMGLPGKDQPGEPRETAKPAPVSTTAADPKPEVEAKPEAKAEPVAADAKPAPERRSFAAAFQTNAAVAAEQTSAQPPQQAAALPATTTPAVAAEARAMHAAYKAPVQQVNIPQVAFEVVRQVQAGNSRFQIRLDPPELGRIDVKLDVDKAGNVNARMTVERAETLDLMQRDQRALERALAQAGLDSSKTNLEFSLRQNPFARDEQQSGQQQGGNGRFGGYAPQGEAADESAPLPQIVAYRGLASAGGVNLFV
jgi:flagellar hook-length control protein FliK